MPLRYPPAFLLSLFVATAIAACETGSETDALGEDQERREDELAQMDGLLVLVDHSIQLFDPSTGLFSEAYAVAVGGGSSPVSVSPDTTQIAYHTPTGITIADVSVDDDGPVLTIIHELKEQDLGPVPITQLSWSADADLVLYDDGAVEVTTGEIMSCPDTSDGDSGAAFSTGLPGGGGFLCGNGVLLQRERQPMEAHFSFQALSADGQLAGLDYHLPTRTSQLPLKMLTPSTNMQLPNGFSGNFPVSVHGTYVSSGEAAQGGFVEVFRRETQTEIAESGQTFSPHAAFESGQQDEGESWPLKDALVEFFEDGEGRYYSPAGISADGERVIYRVNSHRVESDQLTNVLNEVPLEGALLSISKDGDVDGFKTSSLGVLSIGGPSMNSSGQLLFQPEILGPLGLVDLGRGDFVLPASEAHPAGETSWVGRVEGKPWAGERVGVIAQDGRWFARVRSSSHGEDPGLCVTPVAQGGKSHCMIPAEGVAPGRPVAFAGLGLKKANKEDAPLVLSVSRTAAWPESSVILFGARFGSEGKLWIGDVRVPDETISSWSDRRIEFIMNEDVPQAGEIKVETDAGTSGGGRVFWLHQTPKLSTPFDEVSSKTMRLGQGLNVVDLGDLGDFEATFRSEGKLTLSADMRLKDGSYVIHSDGASEDTLGTYEITSGDFTTELSYKLEDRLANPDHWDVVSLLDDFSSESSSSFTHIAGDLVVLGLGGQHPYSEDQRLLFQNPEQKLPGTVSAFWGVPNFWRERPQDDGAWVMIKFDNYQYELRQQTGWGIDAVWGIPTQADAPRLNLSGMTYVEGAGDVVLATGTTTGGAFRLSEDSGLTFGDVVEPGEAISGALREPIRVEAKARTFFMVMESPISAPGLDAIHGIALDGTFTANIAEVPDAELDGGLEVNDIPLQHVTRGGEVLLYFPNNKTLVRADFDGPDVPSWDILPSSDDRGHVMSIYHEEGADEVVVVLDDGTVLRASSDWTQFEAWDLGIDLALPTTVRPLSVGRLADGRWLVHARLYDGRDGAGETDASPLSPTGYVLSPIK